MRQREGGSGSPDDLKFLEIKDFDKRDAAEQFELLMNLIEEWKDQRPRPNRTGQGRDEYMMQGLNMLELAKRNISGIQDESSRDQSLILFKEIISEFLALTASKFNDDDLIRGFVRLGADPNYKDSAGNTALFRAAVDDNSRVIEILIEQGADPNLTSAKDGTTPLYIAAQCNCAEACRALIEGGAKITSHPKDKKATPFHVAAQLDSLDVIDVFLEKKVDVNLVMDAGYTPIHAACCANRLNALKKLVAWGANVNLQDEYGQTPLHIACAKDNFEMVETLIAAGADVDLKTLRGHCPDDLTFGSEKYKIIAAVLNRREEVAGQESVRPEPSLSPTYGFRLEDGRLRYDSQFDID